jgi:hypothetical protein
VSARCGSGAPSFGGTGTCGSRSRFILAMLGEMGSCEKQPDHRSAAVCRHGHVESARIDARMMSGLIGCLLVACAVSGCGGKATLKTPSRAAQRNVAGLFAAAVLRGDAAGASALLVRPDEAELVSLVQRAAAPWRAQHASIELPARRTDNRWTFSYVGTRTQSDGRFETHQGDLVVFVEPSGAGAGVRFFLFTHARTSFSTHHDAQLLPSKR